MTRTTFLACFLLACGGGAPPAPDSGPACEYPAAGTDLSLGSVLPQLSWRGSLHPDDTSSDFTVRDFYCAPQYQRYTSMILIVTAGWCTHCPQYIDMMNGMAESLDQRGSLVVYVELDTASFEPATTQDAAQFIERSITPDEFTSGLRIGDADTTTEDSLLRPNIRSFPSAYFVRRRDMQIRASQSESTFLIDWGTLVDDPESEWRPQLPPFVSRCMPGDEEPTEPNDSRDHAAPIAPGPRQTGGICASGSDFYRVDIAGPWRFDLYQQLFTMPDPPLHDVNLRLWTIEGERVGGSNQLGNHDWVDYQGPAYVEAYGEQNASGAYEVSVSTR